MVGRDQRLAFPLDWTGKEPTGDGERLVDQIPGYAVIADVEKANGLGGLAKSLPDKFDIGIGGIVKHGDVDYGNFPNIDVLDIRVIQFAHPLPNRIRFRHRNTGKH